ncbi:response regulator receiver protein [Pirellula staleyi DSM 6068]|uniref:Response regulator receiver protein n=1 Tax=Pirellula staleyi (strain ATCC 27377 / DSM 6068 / ICPB 4128) TaxID=530564 RepID=D2QXT0_PIRSD|nr:response regulator receiver protein [Pirellula staleyi DSM 6068]
MMGDLLRGLAIEVGEASNGREALQWLRANSLPNIALVDWNMPEMDGLEFLREVRRTPSLRQLPVMMVTTETEMDQMVRALAAGANEYLMKPFTQAMIAEKLQLLGILEEVS